MKSPLKVDLELPFTQWFVFALYDMHSLKRSKDDVCTPMGGWTCVLCHKLTEFRVTGKDGTPQGAINAAISKVTDEHPDKLGPIEDA